jgi:hypothetical protein
MASSSARGWRASRAMSASRPTWPPHSLASKADEIPREALGLITPNLIIGHATGPGFVLGGSGIQVTSVSIVLQKKVLSATPRPNRFGVQCDP